MAIPGFERQLGPAPTAKTTKKKDFWTDQISTGGGIAGSLAGAGLGASIGSVVPGIGTAIGGLIGGIAGGALGSGGGEAVENVVSGEDLWKNVGQEALMGGIFSAPPIRAGKAILGAGKALATGAGTTAAKTAAETALMGGAKAATRGAVQRGTEGALGKAWGVRPGVKVNGQMLTPQKASKLQQFITTEIGVPKTASSEMVLERAVNAQQETGKAISEAIKMSTGTVNTGQVYKSLQSKLGGTIGVDAANNQVAKDILGLIKSAKTPEDLWNVRRQIDDTLISWTRNPQNALPGAEQIARAARKEINNALSTAVPGIKQLNSRYGNLSNVVELTGAATKSPMGFNIPGFQRTVGGSTAQRIRAGVGSVGNVASGATRPAVGSQPIIGSPMAVGTRQFIGQNISQDAQPQPVTQGADQMQGGFVMPTQSDFGTESAQTSYNPYPQENLLYDIQRDPTNASKYIAQYQALQEIFTPAAAKPMSAEAAKNYSNVTSGIQSLQQLASQLESDPGVLQRSGASQVANPFGLTSRVANTGQYDAARQNIVDVIGRLRTGAAITATEEQRFMSMLPQPFDDEATVKTKLNTLYNAFNTVAQGVQNSTAGTDLQSALMQAQGGF